MATTFKQARQAVTKETGMATLADGLEDDKDYDVLVAEPQTDDLVFLVTKSTGRVHKAVYFDVEERLQAMTPVRDE